MKGISKVIMGATLVMVLSLAIVLGLVLVLLAELYCSLLLRRRQLKLTKNHNPTTATTTTTTSFCQTQQETQFPSPLSSFYAQGVFHPPRSFLFPTREGVTVDVERQHGKLHEFLSLKTAMESAVNSPLSPSTSQLPVEDHGDVIALGDGKKHLVYISNPVYDGGAGDRPSCGDHTPFETPDTSPSRLERGGGDEEGDKEGVKVMTPPLTPMKELPAKACSVALSDTRCLGASGSESNSQNAAFSPSYLGSPSTSPSW